MSALARLTLLLLGAAVTLALAQGPFATNDGPIHVAFANLIASYGAADLPLQNEAYLLDLRPNPNLVSYFLLVPLMKLASPQAAEAVLQALCILGPVLAGWFAIRMLEPRNEFLAVALFPFALNQTFFLGLYNYSLSVAAFFIAIGLYLRLEAAPSRGRAAALAGGLLLAFFCHAAGFIMAAAGIGAMACGKTIVRLWRGQAFGAALWAQRHVLASLLAPLPAALLFVSATGGAPIDFGSSVLARLDQFIHLTALDLSSDTTRYAARGLRTALACGLALALLSLWLEWRRGMTPARLEQCAAIVAAGLAATAIMLFIPDTLGGGWTHFKRMVIFPYFWVVLLIACVRIPRIAGVAAVGVGAAASAALLIPAVGLQRTIERQMAPLAEVDRRIGPHCSVAPVIFEPHPRDADGKPMPIKFEPYFQMASRLELKGDRVVLFNYLARLDVYPVRFRQAIEPQQRLFGWRPYQRDVRVTHIDVDAYEQASGMPVDYLLVWGIPDEPNQLWLRWMVEAETRRAQLVYQSQDGWVALYRRPAAAGGRCGAGDLPLIQRAGAQEGAPASVHFERRDQRAFGDR